jgi:tetratricopeptide (TPR) repeat protein
MKADDVIALLMGRRVEAALEAADLVADREGMAERLTEFAGALNYLKGKPLLTDVLLKKSLLLHYENPYTHYNLGILYSTPTDEMPESSHSLEKAQRAYINALNIKPDFHQARYNLALLYYFTDRAEEARKEYARITQALGDDMRFRHLGILLAAER